MNTYFSKWNTQLKDGFNIHGWNPTYDNIPNTKDFKIFKTIHYNVNSIHMYYRQLSNIFPALHKKRLVKRNFLVETIINTLKDKNIVDTWELSASKIIPDIKFEMHVINTLFSKKDKDFLKINNTYLIKNLPYIYLIINNNIDIPLKNIPIENYSNLIKCYIYSISKKIQCSENTLGKINSLEFYSNTFHYYYTSFEREDTVFIKHVLLWLNILSVNNN